MLSYTASPRYNFEDVGYTPTQRYRLKNPNSFTVLISSVKPEMVFAV